VICKFPFRWSIGFCLAFLLSGACPAQNYPDFDIVQEKEYCRALELTDRGRGREAIELLEQIAASHPRSTVGAVSLFRAASIAADFQSRTKYYNQIIAEYPRSRFEIFARASLINLATPSIPRDVAERLRQYDQLLQSVGVPPLASVLKGGPRPARQVRALSLEIQKGLDTIYGQIGGGLEQLQRSNDALALAIFQRDLFPFNDRAASRIRYLMVVRKYGRWTGYDGQPDQNPRIRFKKPSGCRRPKLQWETTAGEWRSSQVNISKMVVLLDGRDIRDQMSISTKVYSSFKTGPNAVFERLKFSFRPTQPLAFGKHTLTLSVPVHGYTGTGPGFTQTQLDFVVSEPRDGDRDDEREDEEEDHIEDDK
jgi:hypothetical protein